MMDAIINTVTSFGFIISLGMFFLFFIIFVWLPTRFRLKQSDEVFLKLLNVINKKIPEVDDVASKEITQKLEVLRDTFLETKSSILENLEDVGIDKTIIDKLKKTISSFDGLFESTCSHIQSSIKNQHNLLFHVENIKADLDILIRTRIVMLKFFEKLVNLAVTNKLTDLDMEECTEMRNILNQYINETYTSDYKTAPLPALLSTQTNRKSNSFSKAFQHEDNFELSTKTHDELVARIVNLERKLSLK